jgi:hypothetical protein
MDKEFETIFNSVNDGILIYSLEGRFLEANKIIFDDLGYPKDELLQMTVMDITPPEFMESVREQIVGVLNQGGGIVETMSRCKDGSLVPIELNIRPIEYKGTPAILAVARNINERKQMEEALHKSEASLSNAQRIAHLGNWDWDIVNNEAHWSDEIYRIFGLVPQDFRGTYEAFLNSVHPDDRMFVQDNVNKAIYENKPYSIEHRILLPDGSERIVHEHAEVTFNEAGQAIRMCGTMQDITERKKADEALQKSEEKHRNLAESLNELIYRADPETFVSTYVNQAVERIYGNTVEEWLNDPSLWEQTIYPDDRERAFAEFTELQTKLESGIVEYRIIKKDKTIRWVQDHVSWEKDQQGKLISMNGIMYDITESKEAQDAMVNAKLMAESASRAKTDFLTNMSHELRTPLNLIIGFSDVICSENHNLSNESLKKYAFNIFRNGEYLLNIINDILSVSKIEAGKMELHMNEFFVSDAIDEVEVLMIPIASEKDIDLTCNIDIEMPAIKADMIKFKQIVYNLVSNAIKFTDNGGTVTIGGKISGDLLHISVKDSGIGISPTVQSKLFEQFFQVDPSTTRKQGGIGLGLNIVKKFTEMHGGYVQVESKEGEGSTFTVALPLEREVDTSQSNEQN